MKQKSIKYHIIIKITDGKLIDNRNLLKAKIIETITFGGMKARKSVTDEIKPLVILIYRK